MTPKWHSTLPQLGPLTACCLASFLGKPAPRDKHSGLASSGSQLSAISWSLCGSSSAYCCTCIALNFWNCPKSRKSCCSSGLTSGTSEACCFGVGGLGHVACTGKGSTACAACDDWTSGNMLLLLELVPLTRVRLL